MFKYKVETYFRDTTGYYIPEEKHIIAIVYAANNKDAIAKAIKLRDGERYESSAWRLFGRVLSCEEVLGGEDE